MKQWWNNSLRVSSRWVNAVILGGYPTETVSGRAYHEGWADVVTIIDACWEFFGERDHCAQAWVIDRYHTDARQGVERTTGIQKG